MIAGGGCDDAALLLVAGKQQQRIARPAFLEAPGALQIFQFAEDFHSRDFRERDGGWTRRLDYVAGDAFGRSLNAPEFDLHWEQLLLEQEFGARTKQETSIIKHQAPEKLPIPTSRSPGIWCLVFDASLRVWSLLIGVSLDFLFRPKRLD